MKHSIEIRKSYIYVSIAGEISLVGGRSWGDIKQAYADVVDQARKNRIYKILVDCRDFPGKVSTLDRFLLAMYFAKENSKLLARRIHPVKVTFVVRTTLLDSRKFGETVARNRGVFGFVTDDMQEALKWLEQDTRPED